MAIFLAQHNHVLAYDIMNSKVELINNRKSPIKDKLIEKYLKEKDLDLIATTDGSKAFKNADFIIIATPTNYDSKLNFFDCSSVESIIEQALDISTNAMIVIKSTVSVGYTLTVRDKFHMKNIIFSPEFLRESKALYDNLYPSRIIVSCDSKSALKARVFTELLSQGALKEWRLQEIDKLLLKYPESKYSYIK